MIRVLLVLILLASIVVPLIPHEEVYADGGIFQSTKSYNGFTMVLNKVYPTVWNATDAQFKRTGTQNELFGQDLNIQGYYHIYRYYVYIDTSAIPDSAIITSAKLSIMVSYLGLLDKDFNITIQNGQPTYPHIPLAAGDYDRDYYSGNGGSINTSLITQLFTGYNITFTAAGLNWINKEGYTKLILRSSRDIVGNPPTNDELLYLYNDNIEGSFTLYVTWVSSGAPSVTTRTPMYITTSSARLRGYLDWDGGSECNVGFNFWEGKNFLGYYAAGTGAHTGDAFYFDMTGLKWNTQYTYAAFAYNGNPAGGANVTFNTASSIGDPSDLVLMPNTCSINVSWVKGAGASNTIVRYQTGSCPLTNASGEVAYNDSDTYFMHSGLLPGTTYYYNAWGWGSGNYSPNGSGCVWVTTLAGSCDDQYPSSGTMPVGWFGAPQYTKMSNLPGYGIINNIADTMHLPYATMWFLLTMAIITIGAFFIYSRTHHLVIAAMFIIVFTGVGGWFGLLPFWICFVYGIGAVGMCWKELT